jgi:predicted glycosyltransferase
MSIRRWFAIRKRARVIGVWPILPGSEKPPVGWPGWPNGKQFALILTHDVEGRSGLAKCRTLMELERNLGFRSSFNFIPEGEYRIPHELRDELTRKGFEVGVHDLFHDGRLYRSRADFLRSAASINRYLKDWGATGFRSGFMHHNLDWIRELDVQYDASTFDTDPFEPQPDGVGTIFPFWVPKAGPQDHRTTGPQDHSSVVSLSRGPVESSSGYVELPYTLPQDSTIFLLFGERHPDVWFQKLDWIAGHGGMALVNVHPDYVRFDGEPPSRRTFPAEFYERFLEYARQKYGDCLWHALPRDVAHLVRQSKMAAGENGTPPKPHAASSGRQKPKIWIDLDNTPHVPFFEPILHELQARNFPVLVTARDAFQVCDLADKKGLKYIKIGRHHGKHRLLKGAGLGYRSLQMTLLILKEKPALGVSHGSRSQILLSNCLGIPTILIEDYEYSQFPPMMRPKWVLAPEVIPDESLYGSNGHTRKYPGIKEDAYAWKLKPDAALLHELGLRDSDLIVTVRPPATEAHYHNPESEKLFELFMNRACQDSRVKVVLLPRNQKQAHLIRHQWPGWFDNQKTVIPPAALDGMNLIWHSDLVVSGGGTMNREAAALGVPVYSIFRGAIGAVDMHLSEQGRLVMVESAQEVDRKINLVKRPRKSLTEVTSRRTLETIVDTIEEIALKRERVK